MIQYHLCCLDRFSLVVILPFPTIILVHPFHDLIALVHGLIFVGALSAIDSGFPTLNSELDMCLELYPICPFHVGDHSLSCSSAEAAVLASLAEASALASLGQLVLQWAAAAVLISLVQLVLLALCLQRR